MLIEIKNDIFVQSTDFRSFNKLFLDLIYKKRYDIFIDIETLVDNEFLDRIDEEDILIIKGFFDKQVTENKNINYIISITDDSSNFNIDEAIRFFSQPVQIILENSRNDSFFIDALIDNFKSVSKNIKRHKGEGWLTYENAGGCNNIPNCLELKFRNYETLPKKNNTYIRAIVIIDSDKEYCSMPIKQEKQNIITFCEQNKIPIIILEKREMENYIPDEVIEDIASEDNDEYLRSYLALTPAQKDYFDIEKGFNKKNYNNLHPEIQNQFSGISNENYKTLRNGFTNVRYKSKFKSLFPLLFKHKSITQDSLLKRTQHQTNKNELKNILSEIDKLL